MTSFLAKITKGIIRLYTFRYRRKQASLSYNIKQKPKKYKCPDGYVYSVERFNGVKVEILRREDCFSDKIILHFHGGGAAMDMSGLFYRKVAQKYAEKTGFAVYSIDYKAGKEKVHPSLLNECFDAYKGLLANGIKGENIIAVGDSMGANLMLATCLKARDNGLPLPAALVSVSAFLDNTVSGDSYFVNAHRDPMYALPFYMSAEKYSHRLRRVPPYAGDCDRKDAYLSPVFGDFTGFPPIFIACGECETDESDSAMLFDAATRDNTDAVYKKYEGMFHDFLYLAPFLRESKEAWKDIGDFVKKYSKT